jgi:hypothetical protein
MALDCGSGLPHLELNESSVRPCLLGIPKSHVTLTVQLECEGAID